MRYFRHSIKYCTLSYIINTNECLLERYAGNISEMIFESRHSKIFKIKRRYLHIIMCQSNLIMKVISKPCIIKGYARENRKFYNHCTIHPTYQWTNKKNAGKKLYRNSNSYLNIQNRKGKDRLRNVGGTLLRLIRNQFNVCITMQFVMLKDILSIYLSTIYLMLLIFQLIFLFFA